MNQETFKTTATLQLRSPRHELCGIVIDDLYGSIYCQTRIEQKK